MQKLRNICIVLNILSGIVSYYNNDPTGVVLSLFLILGFYFIGVLEDASREK